MTRFALRDLIISPKSGIVFGVGLITEVHADEYAAAITDFRRFDTYTYGHITFGALRAILDVPGAAVTTVR